MADDKWIDGTHRGPITFDLVDEPFYTLAGVEAGRFTGELEFAVWDDEIGELNAHTADALKFHEEPIDVTAAFESRHLPRTYPPMPESEAEWRAHCAFYRLAIQQRDAAWSQIEFLKNDKKKETPSG